MTSPQYEPEEAPKGRQLRALVIGGGIQGRYDLATGATTVNFIALSDAARAAEAPNSASTDSSSLTAIRSDW